MFNSKRPTITVAMVTYNSESYVDEAIKSVLNSDYVDFELIISDDCSTDRTWLKINSFKDNRIRASQNIKNIGEYNNRNKCLFLSKGKYIIYVDGDDTIAKHALGTFVGHLENNLDCSFAISRPPDSKMIYPVKLSSRETFRYHYLSDNTVINLSLLRTCFNKEFLANVGGFSTKFKAGDDYIRLLLAQKNPILLIEDGLVWWRNTPGQASEKLMNSYNGQIESFIIKLTFLKSNSCPLQTEEISEAKVKLKYKAYSTWKAILKKRKIIWSIKFAIDVLLLFK